MANIAFCSTYGIDTKTWEDRELGREFGKNCASIGA